MSRDKDRKKDIYEQVKSLNDVVSALIWFNIEKGDMHESDGVNAIKRINPEWLDKVTLRLQKDNKNTMEHEDERKDKTSTKDLERMMDRLKDKE